MINNGDNRKEKRIISEPTPVDLNDGTYKMTDALIYSYNGNQIHSIQDTGGALVYDGSFDFKPSGSTEAYQFNANGAMTYDPNKGITLNYSDWGSPSSITFDSGNSTEYIYGADGRKLKVSWSSNSAHCKPTSRFYDDEEEPGSGSGGNTGGGSQGSTTGNIVSNSMEYVGPFIFTDRELSRFLFDGGYCTVNGNQAEYHYYVKDHLGSNRLVVDENGNVEQKTYYYPFGGVYGDISTNTDVQSYKYNGKELDHRHGLDLYDYGARMYDAAIGSWTTMDPLAEKYYPNTPYGYCGDNPVNRIDPNGLDWYQDEFGHLQWNSDLNADNWQDILSKDSKYLGTTAYSFEHESGIAYFGDENGVLSPYRPFGAEGVVVTGTNLSNTLKAQLFGNSGSIPAGQYSSPNADAISIGIGGSLSLCGIDYGIEAGLIVGNGIISPYVSVYGDIDISSLFNSYRKMPNLAKMIGFNYYGSVMLYNQLGPYENNFNKYSGDGTASTYGIGNFGYVKGKGLTPSGKPVSDMYGITINSSPVVYSKERIKTWIPFSH